MSRRRDSGGAAQADVQSIFAAVGQKRDNRLVPIVPHTPVDEKKIRAAVQSAEKALAPDVIRIMYSFAEDVQGEISLFFRVVISDHAADAGRLRNTTHRIVETVRDKIRAEELGLQTYFNFRSSSEQKSLQDPFWERQ
ncbi:MAG: hypothetical protein LAP38_04615 [Acidobacteriia bacterium]|nr:hypothetical protein [Terriglobia bacterium]